MHKRISHPSSSKVQSAIDEFYGVEDTALHNVDVMTDVSMAPTAFTRYTVAPSTAASRTSKYDCCYLLGYKYETNNAFLWSDEVLVPNGRWSVK